MVKKVQNPGEGFRHKLSQTAINEDDLKAVEYVLDALEEYTWIRGEGPIWLTGSALNDSEYNDIDLMVERGALEYGEEDFNTEHDHEIIYDMLVDSKTYDISENKEPLKGLEEADDLDMKINEDFDIPINRYEFKIDDVKFDIYFCHSPLHDLGIELTPFYGQNKTF